MLTLACILCTTPEAFKILDAQALLNKFLNEGCFTREMYDRGVSLEDIRTVRSADKRYPVYFYRENSRVVGYMYPGSLNIYLNRQFHDSFTTCQTAANLAHELAHQVGMRHFVDVAYATGDSFNACCWE